jgi:hypothetical protein
MRVFLSKTWLGVGCICISALPLMGCKSTGPGYGSGWLSWFNPRPPTSSLSSSPPVKPSVATLPNPAMTTGAGNAGTSTSLASFPAAVGGAGHSHSGGYNTGPYNMSSSSASPQGNSPSAFSASANHFPSQAPAHGGYQSPHAVPAGGGTLTADNRNMYGSPDASAPRSSFNSSYSAAPATSWSSGAYSPANAASAAMPQSGAIPTNYNGAADSRYNAGAGGSYLDRVEGAGTTAAPATAAPGAYRPGSTNRNDGALPMAPAAGNAQPLSASSGAGGAYPTTGYPSTGYGNSLPATQFR